MFQRCDDSPDSPDLSAIDFIKHSFPNRLGNQQHGACMRPFNQLQIWALDGPAH